MYVEKDKFGQIIIQNITPGEAEVLDDCFCSYLAGSKTGEKRTDAEKIIVKLKRGLEKLY